MYHAYTYMDTMDHTDRKTIQRYMLTVHIDYVYSYCQIAALTQTEAIQDAGFFLQQEGTHAQVGRVLAYVCGGLCVNVL